MNSHVNAFLSHSQSSDPETRGWVASDTECPGEILAHLLADTVGWVAEAAFLNPSLPFAIKGRFWVTAAADFDSAERRLLWRLANRENPPEGIHNRLLREAVRIEQRVRQLGMQATDSLSLLSHPKCPTKWVRRAVTRGPGPMRVWVARNPNLTTDLVLKLIQRGLFWCLLERNVEGPRLIRDVIARLSMYELVKLPRELADNQIDDSSDDGLQLVRENAELLALCVGRLSRWVARLDEDVTERVARDRLMAEHVLAEFATEPEQVTALCNHWHVRVRETAARNPVASDEDKVLVALRRITTWFPE